MTRFTPTRRTLAALAGLSLLAACGTDPVQVAGDETGAVTVALTDAASDELAAFCVDVDSIRLRRAGGATVGVLPQPIRVDLVTLTDVSQVLNVLQVPVGIYSSAEVALDFTNADVWLKGENTAAMVLDGDGNALTGQVTLPIVIGGALSAVANRHRILELDFDLDQSVQVDSPGNTVYIEPAIVTRVDRSDPKDLILGGGLLSVDANARTLQLELQTLSRQPIKEVTVALRGLTLYQIDGVPMIGAAGETALAGLAAGSWIQLYGAIDPVLARVDATYVEAGIGTYNGGSDIVEGHVIARTGGAGANATFTVLGHSNDSTHTTFQFNTQFTVSSNFATTTVVRRAGLITRDTDDINVGQRVRLFGSLSGTNLDLSTGVARMQRTRVLGFATAAPSGGVTTMDLERVGLRPEGSFMWNDSGTTPPNPLAFTIQSGGLTTGLGIVNTTALEVHGWFAAVDDSGEDFNALSVINRDLAPSLVAVADRTGGMTVTPAIASGEMTITLAGATGAGEIAVVDKGFVGSTPLPTASPLTIERNPVLGFYGYTDRQTGASAWFLNYDTYLSALQTQFGLGVQLFNLGVLGAYDTPSNTVTAGIQLIVLE